MHSTRIDATSRGRVLDSLALPAWVAGFAPQPQVARHLARLPAPVGERVSVLDLVTRAVEEREAQRLLLESDRLSAIRKAAGLTLDEIGGLVGVSAQTVWRWENHMVKPRRAHAYAYLMVLAAIEEVLS